MAKPVIPAPPPGATLCLTAADCRHLAAQFIARGAVLGNAGNGLRLQEAAFSFADAARELELRRPGAARTSFYRAQQQLAGVQA